MSTRSRIGIKCRNGKVISIYCHFDGYPEHHFPILQQYYNTQEKVEELVSLGDISSLAAKAVPDPDQPHNFEKPQQGVVVAYHRDRGEPWKTTKPMTSTCFGAFVRAIHVPYIYLWDKGAEKWTWMSADELIPHDTLPVSDEKKQGE